MGGEPDPYHLSLATNKKFPDTTRPTIKGYEDYTSAPGPFGDVGFILRGTNDLFDATKQKDFLNAIVQIDQAFAQFLNPQEVDAVKKRLQDMNEAEFTNSFSAIDALKQRFEEMLTAVDPQLKKVYDSFTITTDNAGNFAVALLDLRKEVQDLNTMISSTATDPVKQFTDQIAALDTALNSAAEAGRQALAEGDPTKVAQAEQTLQQAVVARYQYEMQVATQLQQVIEGLKATITGLQQQMYQLRVSEYKDWVDINQRIQSTGGGGVTQLSIYRQAGSELLGAYQGETDPAKKLDMLKQGMEVVDQGLAARMAEIDQWVADQQAAQQTRISALNTEKTQIQAAAQARIDALNQELQLAQQWSSILSGATQALDSMKYGGANPLSAFSRLQFAQSDLTSTTDPARQLQLLQTIGSLGGEAYQRPSPEYQRIYNQVVAGLTDLQSQAQAAHAAELQ